MIKTKAISPQDKTTKKEIGAPAVVKSDNDLWHDLCGRTVEKYNRVQNGKGDSPRNCFSQEYRNNFDLIKWN